MMMRLTRAHADAIIVAATGWKDYKGVSRGHHGIRLTGWLLSARQDQRITRVECWTWREDASHSLQETGYSLSSRDVSDDWTGVRVEAIMILAYAG